LACLVAWAAKAATHEVIVRRGKNASIRSSARCRAIEGWRARYAPARRCSAPRGMDRAWLWWERHRWSALRRRRGAGFPRDVV